MSSPRSVSNASPTNTEGLEKFFRRFFVKAAQVIIQSRQNDKVCTRSCGLPTSNEWFSLNINVSVPAAFPSWHLAFAFPTNIDSLHFVMGCPNDGASVKIVKK